MLPRQDNNFVLALFFIFNMTTILGCTMSETKQSYKLDEVNVRVINEEPAKKVYIIFRVHRRIHCDFPSA